MSRSNFPGAKSINRVPICICISCCAGEFDCSIYSTGARRSRSHSDAIALVPGINVETHLTSVDGSF